MGIKAKELRKKSERELLGMKRRLEFDLMKERAGWGKGSPEEKSLRRKVAKQGQRTSLQRDIRRLIAKINTVLRENEKNY